MPDCGHVEPSMSSRSSACSELVASALGMCCAGTSTPALDLLNLELLMSLGGMWQVDITFLAAV